MSLAQMPGTQSVVGTRSNVWGQSINNFGDYCFDGTVQAISDVPSLNRVVVGGSFTNVGECIGNGVPLSKSTGLPAVGFNRAAMQIQGTVSSAIPDGNNGWYIGGSFTSIGGVPRPALARISSNGSLDPNFVPDLGTLAGTPNITSMVLHGSNLYVGGSFTSNTNSYGAPLDISTGASNFPQNLLVSGSSSPFNGAVEVVIADGSGGWYVGGSFTAVQGVARTGLAHLNSDGSLDLLFSADVDGKVLSLKLDEGTLYVGGVFSTISGVERFNMAALSVPLGTVLSFAPEVGSDVRAIEKNSSGNILVGGLFTTVNVPRGGSRGFAMDMATAAVSPTFPKMNGTLSTVISDGSGGWFVGGDFTEIGGINRTGLVRLLSDYSIDLTFNFDFTGPPGVNSLVLDGTTLYVAGRFTSISGQPRDRLAAIDISTGTLLSWAPNVNNSILDMKLEGSLLYIGGTFTQVSGQTRNRLAAVDKSSGALSSWDPNVDNSVRKVLIDGSTLYIGGDFATVAGQTRNRLASFDLGSGNLTTWNPNGNWWINDMAVSGGLVYLAGAFTSIGGQTRKSFASVDSITGAVTSWNPGWDGWGEGIAIDGSNVYVIGSFTWVGGQFRRGMAVLNASTGNATGWVANVDQTPDSMVRLGSTLFLGVGALMAGGQKPSIGGTPRTGLAELDPITGVATSWNANLNGSVLAIQIEGIDVYLGGWFTTVGGTTRNRVARVDSITAALSGWNPNASSEVSSLRLLGMIKGYGSRHHVPF
ncbi:MAG: hypothetical protein ACK5W9_09880 [Bdellovibrionales bacterium]